MEGIHGFVENMTDEVVGHHGHKYVPYLVTLGMCILTCNLIGLVPGLESPTAVPIVPLGCALLTFVYYNYQGVRTNGPIGYLKHFIGPQDKDMPLVMRLLLPFLLFPIEVFSHLARIMSLTIRLFANMIAGHVVILAFLSLIFIFHALWVAPLSVAAAVSLCLLEIFVAFLQAYVFTLLTAVFVGGAAHPQH